MVKLKWCGCVCLFFLLALGAVGDDVYLVKEGQAQARIYLPRITGKATLFAAHELSDHLEKISGARVPIDLYGSWSKRHAPKGEVSIFLAPKLDAAGEISADGSEDAFSIKRHRGALTIQGNSDTAVLYGVYQFLSELGVRWFTPGELGENVPRMASIPLGTGTRRYAPSFRRRELDYSGYTSWHFHRDKQAEQHHEYDLWLMRNRIQFARSIHGNALHRFDFNWTREKTGHNVAAVLKRVDIEKEPERFALVTRAGETRRRIPRERVQICFSDPRNIQGTVELALEWFAENPSMLTYPTSLQDCGGICECDRCTEINGGVNPVRDPNRLVWTFMNQVMAGIRAELPKRRIAFYAQYGAMTQPPQGLKAEPGIVAVACHIASNRVPITDPEDPFNRRFLAQIKATKATGAEQASYEYTMYSVTPQPLAILSTAKTYSDLGFIGYHTESMGRDAQRSMISWVQAQLAWDASQDPDELLATFCHEYYGAAGEDVLSVLRLVDDSVRELPKVVLGSLGVTQSIMTDEVIASGRKQLKAALRKVDGREQDRLQRFVDTFEMWALQGLYARASYQAMLTRSPADRTQALEAIAAFQTFWDQHHLSDFCSPMTRDSAVNMATRIGGLGPELTPTASEDMKGATHEQLIAAVFSQADVPDDLGKVMILPEQWRFNLDLQRAAADLGWTQPGFDDTAWPELSTWNWYERQGFDRYDGAFCYRVRFKAPVFPADKKVFLRIGALDDEGDVYVNGKLVHTRWHLNPDDWMTSFEIDVTDVIVPGAENVVAVVGNDENGMGGIWKPSGLYSR